MDQSKIGKFIADLRHEKNMTQEELGDKLGVTNKTISRWETGVYMPDIEMLKLLSDFFGVSINEILCGERIDDSEFREKADINIIEISNESAFSYKEKRDFLRQKWIKENMFSIILYTLLCIGLVVFATIKRIDWLLGICPAVWIAVYGFMHNRMMSYIEKHLYKEMPIKKE